VAAPVPPQQEAPVVVQAEVGKEAVEEGSAADRVGPAAPQAAWAAPPVARKPPWPWMP
jgi:hypothetical protein